MMRASRLEILILGTLGSARGDTYAVPSSAPAGAAALDPAPVGVSYVFFYPLILSYPLHLYF